jgi:hypothetical protein
MSQPIPARIIQTAKTRRLSLKQRAMSANLTLLHPTWEYCFFDNDDVDAFVKNEFPQYVDVFNAFRLPIQKYDFFRYLAVYRLGGFYFDLDVILSQSLEPLRSASAVFPFEGLTFSDLLRRRGIDWEIGNYAFGSAPGHPFLKAVIENCVRGQKDPAWAAQMMDGIPVLSRPDCFVLTTTGPAMVTRTLAENQPLAETVTILSPDDICDPAGWNVFGDYGVHVMEGAWRSPRSFIVRRIANWLEARSRDRVLKDSRRRTAEGIQPFPASARAKQ